MSRSVEIMSQVVKDLCFLCEGEKYTGVLSSVKAPIAVPGGHSSTEAAPKTGVRSEKENDFDCSKNGEPSIHTRTHL